MLPLGELLDVGDVFAGAFLMSAITAYPIYRMLIALRSRQSVSQFAPEGHQAKQGTPTMGGLIIGVGAVGGLLIAISGTGEDARLLISLLVLFVGFAVIGFLDDFVVPRVMPGKRGLGWKQKIVLELVIAIGAVLYALSWGASWINVSLAVFLILFMSNAYNFSDGLDGLAGSLLVGLGLGLAALAVHSNAPLQVTLSLAALMGAILPFLYLNAPPAKVFMGDVGSLPIGACLGMVLFVLLNQWPTSQNQYSSVDWQMLPPLIAVSLVMIAELLPVPLQILSVKLRKKKLFPYTPIHHAFEKAGWPESRVVWIFAVTQLVLSGAALYIYVRSVAFEGAQ